MVVLSKIISINTQHIYIKINTINLPEHIISISNWSMVKMCSICKMTIVWTQTKKISAKTRLIFVFMFLLMKVRYITRKGFSTCDTICGNILFFTDNGLTYEYRPSGLFT